MTVRDRASQPSEGFLAAGARFGARGRFGARHGTDASGGDPVADASFDPPCDLSGSADELAVVVDTLWRERECLEHLLLSMVSQQLLLVAGHSRWLHRADSEIRAGVEQLRTAEITRAVETDRLTKAAGCSPESTLAELVKGAPEPWATILDDHLAALRDLMRQLRTLVDGNTRLLHAGEAVLRETLDQLGSASGPTVGVGDAHFEATVASSTYRAALETSIGVGQSSLEEFLA